MYVFYMTNNPLLFPYGGLQCGMTNIFSKKFAMTLPYFMENKSERLIFLIEHFNYVQN